MGEEETENTESKITQKKGLPPVTSSGQPPHSAVLPNKQPHHRTTKLSPSTPSSPPATTSFSLRHRSLPSLLAIALSHHRFSFPSHEPPSFTANHHTTATISPPSSNHHGQPPSSPFTSKPPSNASPSSSSSSPSTTTTEPSFTANQHNHRDITTVTPTTGQNHHHQPTPPP